MRKQEEQRVAELGARQFGVATRQQLAALGVGRYALRRGLETGGWTWLNRAVLKMTPGQPTRDQADLAALLAAGPGAALSHWSAAARLGLAVPRERLVHVTVEATRVLARIAGAKLWRSRDLSAQDVLTWGPFRLTSLGRTVVDLAQVLEGGWLRAVVDSALRKGKAAGKSIRLALEQHGAGRRGAQRLRRLLDAQEREHSHSDSVLESLAMELGLATGRKPRSHHLVRCSGSRVFELDLAWPEVRLCVELDGFEFHGTREAFERDRARDRALLGAGWAVMRYTWRDVTGRRQAVVNELARTWEQRAEALRLARPA